MYPVPNGSQAFGRLWECLRLLAEAFSRGENAPLLGVEGIAVMFFQPRKVLTRPAPPRRPAGKAAFRPFRREGPNF